MKNHKNKLIIIILILLMTLATSVAFAQAETSNANGSVKKSTAQAETSNANGSVKKSTAQAETSGSTAIKKSISKAVVVLSDRQVKATGKAVNPVIESVTLGKTVIPKSAYTVKYYTNGGKKVDNIVKAGRYSIVVKAKEKSKYKGEVSCSYTVLGHQQRITVEETKIKLTFKNKLFYDEETRLPDYILKPAANGDGTGFGFKSFDKSVVEVNKNGEIFAVGKGSTKIKINTKGNVIFHPSRIYVYVEVE